AGLNGRTLLATSREFPKTTVLLLVRKRPLDGLAALSIERLGLGTLHSLLQRLDMLLVWPAPHAPSPTLTLHALGTQRAACAVGRIGPIHLQRHRLTVVLLLARLARKVQEMPLGTNVLAMLGVPSELLLGQERWCPLGGLLLRGE